MQFKFVGNPHDATDGRVSALAYGIRFPLNVAVDVTDSHAIRKLMGNGHFSIVDGGTTFVQMPGKLIVPKEVQEPIQAAPEPFVAEDKGVDPSDLTRDEVIKAATEYGIPIDRRWSTQRITETIQAELSIRGASVQIEAVIEPSAPQEAS
jgi:hypothetical protein